MIGHISSCDNFMTEKRTQKFSREIYLLDFDGTHIKGSLNLE